MRKMKTLFSMDRATKLATDEVIEASAWVFDGIGISTEKFDGTSCLFQDNRLWRRYDRKLNKQAFRKFKSGRLQTLELAMYREPPKGFVACEVEPDKQTGHWPGWVPVETQNPADQFHIEALANSESLIEGQAYELVGPKVQSNLYGLTQHQLWAHGSVVLNIPKPLCFESLKIWLSENLIEGIVWHHPDGAMVKLRRKDFGLSWGK